MNISEFEDKLKAIYQTLFTNEFGSNGNTSYFDVLQMFVANLPERKNDFFVSLTESEYQIEFVMSSRGADLFMVKRSEMNREDPIAYIRETEDWISYEFNLTTLLLTEYVDWVSQQTNNKFYIQFNGYGILVPVKKYWYPFFNPFSYPDKVWIGKEIKSVILIQNEAGRLICIANDPESLKQAQEFIVEK